ncbi:nuclear speckle splicing regulatory protein 1 [Chelonus insularis]|uniref:nuclear speckle splicing regulatory protein 1 n=1 Tax=Chelonus insularis TaxID=460826 RepID=UPI00158E317A|nr:nuclear speckle splicing regulatory protein 1 [Chelonus insularis]
MSKDSKQYGLILSKKPQLSAPKAGNIFGDDDDSEKEDGVNWVKKALKAEGDKNRVKKQTKLNMQKALNQDPTIYQYDEIYDEIERKKDEVKVVEKKEAKKPKYIQNLLKAAERRKREQEHRIERMVQKEREAEGEQYADKESFVTSAYRAKLEEFKKLEEEEARMDRLEAIGDVTKQPDISGFYRQLYSQTVDNKQDNDSEDANKQLEESETRSIDEDEDINSFDGSDSFPEKNSESEAEKVNQSTIKRKNRKKLTLKSQNMRQYRKRNFETSESESDPEEDKNSKDDNDYKNDSYDSSKEPTDVNRLESLSKKARLSTENDHDDDKQKNIAKDSTEFKVSENKTDIKTQANESKSSEEKIEEPKEEKPKVSIWEKRTVGLVFEAALQRYYARKAMRLSGS